MASTPPPSSAGPTAAAASSAAPGDPSTNVEVVYDGTPPFVKWQVGDTFTPTGACPPRTTGAPPPPYTRLPGDDCFPDDRIVRTLDITLFKIDFQIIPALDTSGNAIPTGNIDMTVNVVGGAVIPEGWLGLACPGFSSGPTSFTCALGTGFTTATTGAFFMPVVAPMAMGDGTPFHVTSVITDSGGLPTGTDESEVIVTSARPRFELVKEATDVSTSTGPAGTSGSGQRQEWTIGIRGGVAGYTDVRGLSALAGTITLDDVVTVNTPAGLPEWFHSCPGGTAPGWPELVGGGSPLANPLNQLRAAGVTCTATGNGTPSVSIGVNLSGIDWDRAAIVESPPGTYTPAPTPVNQAFSSSPLPAGRQRLVAYFRLFTWTSHADLDALTPPPGDNMGSAVICNTVETSGPGTPGSGSGEIRPWDPDGAVSTWTPVDVDGRPNFGGALEPVPNNGACVFKEIPPPEPPRIGAFYVKAPITPSVNGTGVIDGGTARSLVRFVNSGNVPYPPAPDTRRAVLCDKWDDSRFDLQNLNVLTSPAGLPFTVEWATGEWGFASSSSEGAEWYRQAHSDCSDNPIPPLVSGWIANPTKPAGANMVRVTLNVPVPVNGFFEIQPDWQMIPGFPPGTEFRNYSAAFLPHEGANGTWQTSNCPLDPNLPLECRAGLALGESAGNNSHWWTTIAGTVKVDKERVGAVNVEAGSTMTWRVRARAVPGPNPTHAVELRDVLPPGFTYVGPTVSASGFLDPGQPTCTPPVGTVIDHPNVQTCKWAPLDLPFLAGGAFNIDVTFPVAIDPFAPPGLYTNLAEAETPDDPTSFGHPAADIRRDTADVRVLAATRAHIDKSVSPSLAGPGDTITFTLRYGNPSSMAVNSMDATDLLPFNGDPRGSSLTAGSFVLTGINPSSTGGEEAWVSNENPAALDLVDGVADGYLDPASAGPLSGPRWCLLADIGTGGCPPTIASVTAVRFVGSPTAGGLPFLPAGSGFHVITVTYQVVGCTVGDKLSNSWMARFEGLFFPVLFPAQAAGVGGCVSSLGVVKEVRNADGQWVDSTTLPAGSDVSWRITVTNTGTTTLTGLTFTDPTVTGCETAGAAAAPTTLAPGESFTFTCIEPSVGKGHTNTVEVRGVAPNGDPVEDSDDAIVDIPKAPDGKVAPPPVIKPLARSGPLALTGAFLGRVVKQALLALGLGLVAVLSTTKRRNRHRVAFARWVDTADLDQLVQFARNLSKPSREGRG